MRLHLGSLDGDQALELAVAHALVRRAGAGELGEVLRIYRPSAPVAVFGRRDTRLPGFAAAAEAAATAGFERSSGPPAVVRWPTRATRSWWTTSRTSPTPWVLTTDGSSGSGRCSRRRWAGSAWTPGWVRSRASTARGAQRQRSGDREARRHRSAGDQERVAVQLAGHRRRRGPPPAGAGAGVRTPRAAVRRSLTGEAPALDVEAVERALLAAYGADASSAEGPDPTPCRSHTTSSTSTASDPHTAAPGIPGLTASGRARVLLGPLDPEHDPGLAAQDTGGVPEHVQFRRRSWPKPKTAMPGSGSDFTPARVLMKSRPSGWANARE